MSIDKKSRRFLRLKEWQPLLDTLLRPTAAYIAATDGSVEDTEYRLRTDADGFIVSGQHGEQDAEAPCVIVLGDSFVESVYVAEASRFVAVVERRLRDSGLPVRCLNGGYSGATTLHMLLALIGKIGRRPRTTVVLVVPSNDALSLVKEDGYWCRTDKRYTPIVPIVGGAHPRQQELDLAEAQSVLTLFTDACRRLRLGLVLATFPHRQGPFDQDPWLQNRFKNAVNFQRHVDWRCGVNSVARATARRLGVGFLDLEALVSREARIFYDDLHLNEAGSAVVGQMVANALLERQAMQVKV